MAERSRVEAAVLATHQGIYDAIEAGDIDLMRSLWGSGDDAVFVPLGAEPVRGTAAVLRAWTVIMASTGYIQFILTDTAVTLGPTRSGTEADVAVVSCTENVLADAGAEAFAGGRAVATTVLTRATGGWQVWAHHTSPIASIPADEEDG